MLFLRSSCCRYSPSSAASHPAHPAPSSCLWLLVLLAALSSAVGEGGGEQCLQVTMRTPGDCADDSAFTDAFGYPCTDWEDLNCITTTEGYSPEELEDVVLACPKACSLCGSCCSEDCDLCKPNDATEMKMVVEIYDYSTGEAAEYSSDTSFTGVGPTFASSSSAVVTQTVCLNTPSCYKIRVTLPPDAWSEFIHRTSFEVTTSPGGVVIASALGSDDWLSFCLADCPAGTTFDVKSELCQTCDYGVVTAASFCMICEPGEYLDWKEKGSAACASCPLTSNKRLQWSKKGALTTKDCFAVENNFYLASENPLIVAFEFKTDSYAIVVEGDGNIKYPADIEFVTPYLFFVTDFRVQGVLLLYDVDGGLRRKFKIRGARAIGPLVRVPSSSNRYRVAVGEINVGGFVLVVDFDDWIDEDGRHITNRDDDSEDDEAPVEIIPTFTSLATPSDFLLAFLSVGEYDWEVLASTTSGEVYRFCIAANCEAAVRNGLMFRQNDDRDGSETPIVDGFAAIDVIRSEGTYLVADYDSASVFRCDLRIFDSTIGEACTEFTSTSMGSQLYEISALLVDPIRELVYVVDYDGDYTNVYTYLGGSPIARVGTKSGDMRRIMSMAVRPGVFAPLSKVAIPPAGVEVDAGVSIGMDIFLRDSLDVDVSDKHLFDPSRFRISASGDAVLSDGSTKTVTQEGSINYGGGGSAPLTSEIVIKIAGRWQVSIMERNIAVPAHFQDSPFTITVVAAETDPGRCKVSLKTATLVAGESWQVSVQTYDTFGNPTNHESDAFEAWFQGREKDVIVFDRDDERNPETVSPAIFSCEREVRAVGVQLLHIKHSKSGKDLAGSPFVLQVAMSVEQRTKEMKDEAERMLTGVSVGVGLAILAIAGAFAFRIWKTGQAKVAVLKTSQNFLQQKVAEKENEIESKENEIQNLHESLSKKEHTEEELQVMREAMETMSRSTSDELRGVIVDSRNVKILTMLGKGGFGVVHLGDYNGAAVAVKQLLEINPESVARFRFECFLMKNLRHPYIVRLVGVCWDSSMLACLLEFIGNGSLDDHLKRDLRRPKESKMTWKDRLLKVAIQSATAVQYLHHSRYFDEKEDCWKECIIHRDLKPDNILVTDEPEFTVKLSDFGEARASELNLQMTTVGTPIFIAPEILRNDRYDAKVDVYSYSIVLVAMLRAEKDVVTFFFEALRKAMKKKNTQGIGINILNNRMMNQNFRPTLPIQLYPSLKTLIYECWSNNPEERPTFSEIVTRLSGVITLEVNCMSEPDVAIELDGAALSSVTTPFDEHSFRGGSDDLLSLRKSWDEERSRLEAELERVKLAEENTKQLEIALTRQLEEEIRKRVSLEERMKENSAAAFHTERHDDEGKEGQLSTIRLG